MVRRSFCALLPGLSTEVGHVYPYHLAVERSTEIAGWKYSSFIPETPKISNLPKNWKPLLANDYWDTRKTIWFRLKSLFLNSFRLFRAFQLINEEKEAIVFLEHFDIQLVGSLFFALLFIRPSFHFWILHRYAYGKRHWRTQLYRLLHLFLEKKFGADRVRYLTDSDLLAHEQQSSYRRTIHVVPIPHTAKGAKLGQNGETFFWFPGGSLRKDKGLSAVQALCDQLRPEHRLVIAEEAKTFLNESPFLVFVPTTLSHEAYQRWMRTVDAVLLPYSAASYAHRTSGIFVEAICFGSTPIVSKGTWMAHELRKHGLLELAIEWDGLDLPNCIAKLIREPAVQAKLAKMRAHYQEFHSEEGFAFALQQIANS